MAIKWISGGFERRKSGRVNLAGDRMNKGHSAMGRVAMRLPIKQGLKQGVSVHDRVQD